MTPSAPGNQLTDNAVSKIYPNFIVFGLRHIENRYNIHRLL